MSSLAGLVLAMASILTLPASAVAGTSPGSELQSTESAAPAAEAAGIAAVSEPVGPFPALLLPDHTALFRSKFDERIAEVKVRIGTRVKKGQLLVRLVDEVQRAEVERQSVVVEQKEAELARYIHLKEREGISEEIVEEIEYELRIARADLREAQFRLDERSIRAPFDGVLAERYVDAGGSVMLGDPLVRVTALSPLRLEALLPETVLGVVMTYASVRVILSEPETVLTLPLVSGTPVVDPASGTFPLQIVIDNPYERLIPGVVCSILLLATPVAQP